MEAIMAEMLYKWRVVIAILAAVMTALAIERTIDSGHMHGVGEGGVALVLWIALVWSLTTHSKSAGVKQSTNFWATRPAMGLVQPNITTKAVVARPFAWALFMGLLAGVVFGALARSSGTALAIGVGVGAFVVLFLFNFGYGASTTPALVGIDAGPTVLRGLPISWIRYSPCSLPQALVPTPQARIGSSGRRSPWAGVALSYRSRFVSNGISNSDE
jgi:hypothetical protein